MNKAMKITLIVIAVSAVLFGGAYLKGASVIEDAVLTCVQESIESGVAEGNKREVMESLYPMLRNTCINKLTARGVIPAGIYD